MSELNIIKEEIETLNEKLAEKMARNQDFEDSSQWLHSIEVTAI